MEAAHDEALFASPLFDPTVDGELEPNEFNLVKLLGSGKSSKVVLVQRRTSQERFALKIVTKSAIASKKQHSHLCTERNILRRVQHPFVVKYLGGFETAEKVHFLFEHCSGGELFQKLKKHRFFPEEWARLYAAEVVLAIEYLHSLDIVYRDLKPENLVISKSGHICLIDFGLSKEGMSYSTRSYSFVGTPEYMSPEMVQQEGHTRSVDWWTVGVLLFEMLTGLPPFYAKLKDVMYQQIVKSDLQIPSALQDPARSLISALLTKDPEKRLGAGPGGAQEVKAHEFFGSVDWDKLLTQEAVPPSDEPAQRRGRAERQDGQVSLQDFDFLATIGENSFGKVMLVRAKSNGKMLAMKAMKLDSSVSKSQVKHAQAELHILQKHQHPCLPQLHHQFHTASNLVLVLDYISGGSLEWHLKRTAPSPIAAHTALSYAAQLVLALQHLHTTDVIFRALQPAAILIRPQGGLVLSDLGLAKQLPRGEPKTSTFCGPPLYIAPEVVRGRRYSNAVDWWMLGAVWFEMATGHTPFSGKALPEICASILNTELSIPHTVGAEVRVLVASLLEHNPAKRAEVAAQIRSHPAFHSIAWDQLLAGQHSGGELAHTEALPRFEPHQLAAELRKLPELRPGEVQSELETRLLSLLHCQSQLAEPDVEGGEGEGNTAGGTRAAAQIVEAVVRVRERCPGGSQLVEGCFDCWKMNYSRALLRDLRALRASMQQVLKGSG